MRRLSSGQKTGPEANVQDCVVPKSAEGRLQDAPKIEEIPVELLDPFPDHPFKVRMDEDMMNLVESVRERGIISPIVLRPKDDGRYEIISGHRRAKACEIVGLPTIRAQVHEMGRDEAIIMMVESNFQRSMILPSEKAFSYKMRYEALKRVAGTRTDLTGDPVGPRLKTSEMVASEVNDSATQVKRYIRLTNLIPEILKMVDEGAIGLRPAVELSYLTRREQIMLVDAMAMADCTPSHAQAIRLRAFSRDGTLGSHIMERVMSEEKPNQREKISLRYSDARRFIPDSVPYNRTNEYIMKALEFYQRHLERQKSGRDAR